MSRVRYLHAAVTIAVMSLTMVAPATAQGNGNARERGNASDRRQQVEAAPRQRPTLQRRTGRGNAVRPRTDDRLEDRRDADRLENRRDADRLEDRRDADRRRDSDWDDILRRGDDDGRRRNVPPGWCIGRGNPHNTPENCGYGVDRRRERDRNDRYGVYSSYSEAHAAFHRALDREYSDRAAEGRGDPFYQLRLRAQKAEDHERWHERTGTRH